MVPIAPFGIFGSVFQGSGGMVALAYVIGMVAGYPAMFYTSAALYLGALTLSRRL